MQFAELLGRGFGRRAHQQILGLLVHREQRDLAQVLDAAEQHHDAVDAGRHAAVRRRAEFQRPDHAAEAVVHHLLAVARNAEGLVHDLGLVVADGAGADLEAVANHVVLIGLERESASL